MMRSTRFSIVFSALVSCVLVVAISAHATGNAEANAPLGRVPRSRRCAHDDADNIRAMLMHGMDMHVPQKTKKENTEIKPDEGRQRAAGSNVTSSPLRVTLSLLDLLPGSGKYCTTGDGNVPDVAPSASAGSTVQCTNASVLTSLKRELLLNSVLPIALRNIQDALWLETPTVSPLMLPSNVCKYATKNTTLVSGGYVDTDFVLFVTAVPTTNLAWATFCAMDSNSRIIAAHVNIDPDIIDVVSSDGGVVAIETVEHELLHGFGFSHGYIQAYINSTSRPLLGVASNVRGKPSPVSVFTGPLTTKAVETYFNCSDSAVIVGAELEDEGGAGTALSHWDRRMLQEELMTGGGGNILSPVTLALFADLQLGFVPKPEGLQSDKALMFGRNAGCAFISEKCNSTENAPHFCFSSRDEVKCTADGSQGIGFCDIGTDANDLPVEFQYFAGEPKKGGSSLMDRCPYYTAYGNLDCKAPRASTSSETRLGHVFSSISRCFETFKSDGDTSSFKGIVAENSVGVTTEFGARCLETRCVPVRTGATVYRLEVSAGGKDWVMCPTDGSGPARVTAPPGFSGTIECPPAASLCNAPISSALLDDHCCPIPDIHEHALSDEQRSAIIIVAWVLWFGIIVVFCCCIRYRMNREKTVGVIYFNVKSSSVVYNPPPTADDGLASSDSDGDDSMDTEPREQEQAEGLPPGALTDDDDDAQKKNLTPPASSSQQPTDANAHRHEKKVTLPPQEKEAQHSSSHRKHHEHPDQPANNAATHTVEKSGGNTGNTLQPNAHPPLSSSSVSSDSITTTDSSAEDTVSSDGEGPEDQPAAQVVTTTQKDNGDQPQASLEMPN